MRVYTYTTLLEDFIEFEYDQRMFDIRLHNVYVWSYLRFIVYSIILDHKIAKRTSLQQPIIRGYKTWYVVKKFESNIKRNVMFAHKRDALIVAHGRKIQDGGNYVKDWNTGYLNSKLKRSHYFLERPNSAGFHLYRENNILTYHLFRWSEVHGLKKIDLPVDKNELYEKILRPIEIHYEFEFSFKEKKRILSFAHARVGMDHLMKAYCRYLLKKIRPKVIILAMITDSIMQVFCEIAKEMKIPTVYLQEGAMFEAVPYYFYKPQEIQRLFFPDYIFCYGDYEKEYIRHYPIEDSHVIPVGSPDLEEYSGRKYPMTSAKKQIMVISSAEPILRSIAGELSENLDSTKYQVIYKIHPREDARYDAEIAPVIKKYRNLKVIRESKKKAYRYFDEMSWVVGVGSVALYEATKFKKKIAIIDPDSTLTSPLLEKNAAIRVKNCKELANEIITDSFTPDFSFKFYYDDAIEKINENIEKIIAENTKK